MNQRDAAHLHPPCGMRPVSLASYSILQAVGSMYLTEKPTQLVDALLFWYIHTAPIHDAAALTQCTPAQAEIVALAASSTSALTVPDGDEVDVWARQQIACIEASRAISRDGPSDSKN